MKLKDSRAFHYNKEWYIHEEVANGYTFMLYKLNYRYVVRVDDIEEGTVRQYDEFTVLTDAKRHFNQLKETFGE